MIPRKNGIEAEGIPSVSVETSESTIPRKPIFLEGGPGPTPEPVIQSLSVTENGTYNAPSGVDGYNPVVVNVDAPTPPTPTVYSPTNIKLQKTFTEPHIGEIPGDVLKLIYTDWVYLESAGGVLVPPLPNDNLYTKMVVSDIQNPTSENITNATIFYCFSSNDYPHARGSYPNDITYGGGSNSQDPPTKIYSYDPAGNFEWTEIVIDTSTWEGRGYANTINRIIFSNTNVIRHVVNNVVYYILQNLIGDTGKISDPYKTDYYDVYYCIEGTKTNTLNVVTELATVEYIGNMTLKSLYDLLTSGSFPPNE